MIELDGFISWLIDALNWALSKIFFFLPESPFKGVLSDFADNEVLQYINWFLPVGEIVGILALWLTAIIGFYAYQVILRWIKAIGN